MKSSRAHKNIAKQSIEKLFEEDFKPLWQQREEKSVKESLEVAVTVAVDYNYKQSAAESRSRIVAKTQGVRYNN